MESHPIRRALLSVYDKTGVLEFARALRARDVEILSTGGTARALREACIDLVDVGEFTGFPEMLDGRVKTLHPRVHAGILFRRDLSEHRTTLEEHDLAPIDLVVVNLYPFEETVAREGVTRAEAIEQIDIGGPTLLRSAAKNHAAVTVVSSALQYAEVLRSMEENDGATDLPLRQRLAASVYARTAAYDAAISNWFESEGLASGDGSMPEQLSVALPRSRVLRYGENPHQAAALYGDFLERFEQLHGRAISYNNILDLAGALDVVAAIRRRGKALSIIKHSNPCGAAVGDTIAEAWTRALACDPQSASGGIVASSEPIDRAAAEAMGDHFIELLVAPSFDDDACEILQRKKNRILLRLEGGIDNWGFAGSELVLKSVPGGVVAMQPDRAALDPAELRVVTKRAPSDTEMEALLFGWDVVPCVKSNAIVYAASDRLLGVGAGQMSRVDSAHLGVRKARDAGLSLAGAVVASDAFFPFPDGLLVAADAGITAAIQPGGSVRDEAVIAAADERGLAMVFTGRRHFRH